MQARLRLVQGEEGGQPVGEERARQGQEVQRPVGQFGGVEHALGIIGKDHAEARLPAGHRDHEAGAGECAIDGRIEIGHILPQVSECCEDGGEIRPVGRERRGGDGQARPAQGRARVGAERVVEAPRDQGLADELQLRKAHGVLQGGQGGLGRQEVDPEFALAPVLVADEARRAVAAEHRDGMATRGEAQALDLDLRFEGKGPAARSAGAIHADLADFDLVAVGLAGLVIREVGRQAHPGRLVLAAYPRPEHRVHAPLCGEIPGQPAECGCLQQFEGPVEVGLARAVASDEHREPANREGDPAEGAIACDAHIPQGKHGSTQSGTTRCPRSFGPSG